MFENKKKIALIGLPIVLLLIIATFYSAARAQPIHAGNALTMINDWKSKNLKYGQWIHLVSAVTSETSNGVILPDGSLMPSSYIQDDWYYVNEDGLAEKGVFSMKDNNGNILQQSAYQDNTMINLTFDFRQENQKPNPILIDFGFGDRIIDSQSLGIQIEKSDETVNEKPVIVYSYIEKLKLPTQFNGEDVIVESITTKGYFDKETEDFIQIQTIWNLDNGAEIIFDTVEVISIEGFPQAPDEILKVLEAVK